MSDLIVHDYDVRVVPLRARMPFRYGIAALTEMPQVLLFLDVTVGGARLRGIAADALPPKWFTKDASRPYEEDARDMIDVILNACGLTVAAGGARSVFGLWREVSARQSAWATERGFPPLLGGFGVSLVERALIDAQCRAAHIRFADAVRQNLLGIELGGLHAELGRAVPRDFLPESPSRRVRVRHTVGLGDPLTDAEIGAEERLVDGLPQSLEAAIARYGLTHFKIKVPAEPDVAAERLRRVADVVARGAARFAFTLDGNEFLSDMGALRELWSRIMADGVVAAFIGRGLIALEQPLARDVALSDGAKAELLRWKDRPPMIIDESDAEVGSARRALDCGYAGTAHKNCKGVIKGIANACLIELRRRTDGASLILTAEDLVNFGPVAPLQDMAVVATLGLDHAERNGHHYFGNMRAYPEPVWRAVLGAHADVFREDGPGGPPIPDIRDGALAVDSIVDAPFGLAPDLDPAWFQPLAA